MLTQRYWPFVVLLSIAAFTAFGSPLPTHADVTIRTVAAFSQGQFPEGMSVAPDGTIIAGVINTGDVLRVTANGTVSRLAHISLPQNAFLTGVFAVDSTNVYALVFSQDDKNGVWAISQHGASVAQFAKLPTGSGPNDLVRDAGGRLYVTDMLGGRIFRVLPDGSVTVWARDNLLLGNVSSPGPLGFPIGANGIALSAGKDALYVGVTEKSRIVRIPIRSDGSAGAVTVLAENPLLEGSDGIDVAPNGVIYAAVNAQNQVVSVDPSNGSVQVVASGSVFRFPSSVRFAPGSLRSYVLNFDGSVLFGLAPGPASTGILALEPVTSAAPVAPGVSIPPAPVVPAIAISPPNTG